MIWTIRKLHPYYTIATMTNVGYVVTFLLTIYLRNDVSGTLRVVRPSTVFRLIWAWGDPAQVVHSLTQHVLESRPLFTCSLFTKTHVYWEAPSNERRGETPLSHCSTSGPKPWLLLLDEWALSVRTRPDKF